MTYPLRVSRADAIAIVDRGGDYPVHATFERVSSPMTACGRRLRPVVNWHPDETRVSCARCRRRVGELKEAR